MRIKTLFSIPDGEKVTEKALRKVLISSICSILLCMTCLVSTTWAWFAVSIENTGNVIQIATVTADVSITGHGNNAVDKSAENQYELQAGTYAIKVKVENDKADWKRPVYVLMSVASNGECDYYYLTFMPDNDNQQLEFACSKPVAVSFSVAWVEPASAVSIGDEAVVTSEAPTEPTTVPSTESETAATTVPTTVAAPAPATEPSAAETTIPSTGSTEATAKTATIPTTAEEATEPSETTSATEETPIPDADATTAPTTAPTSIPTEAVTESEETTSPAETG